MRPGLRKLVLAAHIALSVGWLGSVVAYIALDLAASIGQDAQTLRAAYLGMDLVARTAIVPLAAASLITGIVIASGTKWGLFRHWWVVISLLLTIVAALVLVMELRTIGSLAAIAADPATPVEVLRGLGGTLLHSVGGLVALVVVLVLNVYKPRGLTPYGWRKQQEERLSVDAARAASATAR